MEISKPLMSPTYLNGVTEERMGGRPESPRSPTKTVIPITPGLVPPTPFSSYTPSPEPAPTNSSTLSVNTTYSSIYTPITSASYASSPVTPRREDTELSNTPRKRSNSSTERETEKECTTSTATTTTASSSSRGGEVRRPSRNKDGVSNPMKSFRVNLDDPCWKVLPAAMKKYDVKGREEDYRLYITYGDTGSFPRSKEI
jgi:protein STE50